MRVVAFGGGHGLSASLRALRLLRAELDAGDHRRGDRRRRRRLQRRLRADRGGLPPGDLRQALAALADPAIRSRRRAADLLQYRFDGDDPLAGHAVGNLLLPG